MTGKYVVHLEECILSIYIYSSQMAENYARKYTQLQHGNIWRFYFIKRYVWYMGLYTSGIYQGEK